VKDKNEQKEGGSCEETDLLNRASLIWEEAARSGHEELFSNRRLQQRGNTLEEGHDKKRRKEISGY